jgi:hypothetical protein
MLNFNKLKTYFTMLALASSSLVQAQNTSIGQIKPPRQTELGSEYQFKLGFQYNQLVEDVGDVVGNEHQTDANFSYHSDPSLSFTKNFDVKARLNSADQLMFSLSEAYLDFKFKNSNLSFGRVPLDWSKTDEIWGFGMLNNRVNFDFFEPGQEGLIGAWFKKRPKKGFQFDSFISFLYAPEMNPGLTIDNDTGEVICDNPWCKPPASEAEPTPGNTIPVRYSVDFPEITDVVLRYSVGMRMGYKWDKFEVSGFFMRKPENQISITAEVVVEPDNSVVNAFVTPQFYYHNLYGGRLDYNPNKNWNVYAAALSTNPSETPDGNVPNIDYTELKIEKRSQHYVATGVNANFLHLRTGINYIARTSDFDIEEDLLVEYPRWNQAVNVYLQMQLTSRMRTKFDFKMDTLTNDRLTVFDLAYQMSPTVATKAGVRMIGSDNLSFWSDFQNNDSVFGGVDVLF